MVGVGAGARVATAVSVRAAFLHLRIYLLMISLVSSSRRFFIVVCATAIVYNPVFPDSFFALARDPSIFLSRTEIGQIFVGRELPPSSS